MDVMFCNKSGIIHPWADRGSRAAHIIKKQTSNITGLLACNTLMRILLVDDDENLMDLLAERLIQQRYAVDVAIDGSTAQTYLDLFEYDLVVLDLMLPDGDGIEFAQRFRQDGYTNPLMILTAKETTTEKVRALDAGADDYVVKPFDFDELCARIRALLRRENNALPAILSWGSLQLDPSACKTTYNGHAIRLTPKEFAMMELFLRHPYRIYSLGAIIEDLWSFEDPPSEDAVRTHIKGLRRKLREVGAPKNLIKTVYGLGYQLNESAVDPSANGLGRSPLSAVSRVDSKSQLSRSQLSKSQLEENSGEQVASQVSESLISNGLTSEGLTNEQTGHQRSIQAAENRAREQTNRPLSAKQNSHGTLEASASTNLNQRLTAAYDRYLTAASVQLTTLEHLLQAITADSLTTRLYQQSLAIAHNLSGSLGSFGFAEGSRLAQSLESQLRGLNIYLEAASINSTAHALDEPLTLHGRLPNEVVARLAQSVQALSQLVHSAERQPPTSTLSTSVQSGLPVLLIVSEDSQFAQRLSAIAPQAYLQTKQVETLTQARALLKSTRCDLLLIDFDVGPFEMAKTASSQQGQQSAARSWALIKQIKKDYLLPVMITAQPLDLARRLNLIEQGVDVVNNRSAEPLQILLAAAEMIKAEGKQGRVAIADDDPDTLALFKTSLEPWGFKVTPFESAPALWHWLDGYITPQESVAQRSHSQSPSPQTYQLPTDILVLDIEMPTFNGLELCRVIRADTRFQSIPILFLTKHQETALRTQAYQVGGDDFIHKAVAPAELAVRLRNQLKRACRL